MQMSAAVRRNAVCGPGCAEIVALGDGMQRPILSLGTSVGVFWRSVSLAPFAAPQSARDPGCFGQDQDHRGIRLAIARNWDFRRRLLPPMRPRLQPENDRRELPPSRPRTATASAAALRLPPKLQSTLSPARRQMYG